MNLFDQLNRAFDGVFVKPKKRATHAAVNKPWLVQQQRADAKYKQLLTGKTLPTGDIAQRLGLSHMGCLTSLYNLEKRGLVERVGALPRRPSYKSLGGRGQILWTWIP